MKRHPAAIIFTQALLDSLCVLGAFSLAAYVTSPGNDAAQYHEHFVSHLGYFVAFVVFWCGAATDQRLFASRRGESLRSQLTSVVKAVAISLVFTGFAVVFFTKRGFDQVFLLYFGVGSLAFLLLFRALARLAVWNMRRRGFNYRQILIVGGNERAKHLVDLMMGQVQHGYHLTGLLDDDADRVKYLDEYHVPYLGRLDDLDKVLLSHVIDEVYVCLPVRTYYEKITSMAHLCEGIGTPIHMIADLFPLRIATSRVRQFEDIPLLSLSAVPEAQMQLILKRIMDLAVSSLFLATVAWWLFPLVAVLIKLDSEGPVFFPQERVGLSGRRFKMIKFRSMIANADALKKQLEAMNEADGPVFKIRNDPRMTRVGRWIRKFSIDELPQFVNVFVGHMSLVGPRPPVPREVEKYTWDQRRRLSVRPGITGLQQVSGRSDLDFEQWVELDLAYIDHWSLVEDFRILIRTFEVVVLAKGAA